MEPKPLKPYYPLPSIGNLTSLAGILDLNKSALLSIASKSEASYTSFEIKSKNGKSRIVHEPMNFLKKIQKRINSRIFEKVRYPSYLQGGIKDSEHPRDYIANAALHCGQKSIITLDIKNFYPNIKKDYVFNVFSLFFKFSDDVSEILTNLTTYQGRVPQGACTSSYLANLVFFNTEYTLASQLKFKGYQYSRLLDDITISSSKTFTEEEKTELIRKANGLFKKYDLKQNNKKRTIETRSNPKSSFSVTGVWVGNNEPRIRKQERHHIRQLVYICEQKSLQNTSSEDYHELWNEASGKVAKLTRLKHVQALPLRDRLSKILPTLDQEAKNKLIIQIKNIRSSKILHSKQTKQIEKINRLLFQLGILSRTDKRLAKNLRKNLTCIKLPTKKELWDDNEYL